jgi:outer membrane protein assembly factor BamB
LWWGKNEAWLKCFAMPEQDGATNAVPLWTYPLVRHTFSTPAVGAGLVLVTDCGHTLHCVDARTGQGIWTHEADGEFWASPLVADGRVYAGTRRGQFLVMTASREKRLLATMQLGSPISATAAAANGVLYVATMKQLFAVAVPRR